MELDPNRILMADAILPKNNPFVSGWPSLNVTDRILIKDFIILI